MKQIITILLVFLISVTISAQTITGKFSQMPNTSLELLGIKNFDTYPISTVQTDAEGNFSFTYNDADRGMAFMQAGENNKLILALEDQPVAFQGKSILDISSLTFNKGQENQSLVTYVTQQRKREQVLSAWRFLQKAYTQDTFFEDHQATIQAVNKEIQTLQQDSEDFIAQLPEDSYMKWYLPLRTLLSSVGSVAQNQPELIPKTLRQLRAIDYKDERLNKSGLFYDAVFNHIWFIENSSGPLEQVFEDLNTSIDIIAEQLKGNDERFNLVMEKMFEILEERSLFTSSEYLADKLLNSDDCGCLNPQLQKKLERYGKLAQGQIAPDINFTDYTYYPEGVSAKSLKAIDADYKLVVFAAGWCPHCKEAMPKVSENYKTWKDKGLEVIFVSLDTNPKDFASFAGPLPFVSTTDFKKWEGQAVEDYQVYATPSYFLLNKDLEILIRPKSVEHANAWIEAFVK